MKALGIDVSYYQQAIDWQILKDNGVDFVIIRCQYGQYEVDPKFYEHYDAAIKIMPMVGVYVWHDPILNPSRQAAATADILKDRKPAFIALDIEQYWSNWAAWREKRRGEDVEVPRFNDGQISASAQALYTEHKKLGMPVVIYTSAGFVNSYSPSMKDWIKDVNLWLAQYPALKGIDAAKISTWADFKSKVIPLVENSSPLTPRGIEVTNWKIWQFTGDKFKMPGTWSLPQRIRISATDVNIFNGTFEDMCKLFKTNAPITEPIKKSIEQRIEALENWAKTQGATI